MASEIFMPYTEEWFHILAKYNVQAEKRAVLLYGKMALFPRIYSEITKTLQAHSLACEGRAKSESAAFATL